MKKIKLLTLIFIATLCISCSSKKAENNSNDNTIVQNESYIDKKEEVKAMEETENNLEEKDSYVVYDRYSNIDKNKLKYESLEKDWYFYETSNGFVVALNTKITSTQNGKNNYDKECISGISYLKEIV
ncbi:hypothetical protein NNC19_16320 [Clostridium sp. SHJSY1]|uniref:hypothetical protein n=1 Tax=Clostridium sp. SHJSY1 TaxID=2942483 RepID=UPI0028766A2A|nr:hypothetical protein [Clostridium sp. SHJSY1]MDS0527257.1 hypothetical protein [Clostridium sp. SHJSY1]